MDEHLFIVVYRSKGSHIWKAISEGELPERRLAENLIECKRAAGWSAEHWDFAIVEGPIISPEEMALAAASLGEF